MSNACKSRHRKSERITFDELMGAAGMSGFGALFERPQPIRPGLSHVAPPAVAPLQAVGRAPVGESQNKGEPALAAVARRLDRQDELIGSLGGVYTRRVTALQRALQALTWLRTPGFAQTEVHATSPAGPLTSNPQ